jgi:GT2 family glycosyltransferase
MDEKIALSVVIVSWNTRTLLAACLDAVYRTVRGLCYEVIVVDNGSGDGSTAMIREKYPRVKVLTNAENRGFGAACNQGLRIMTGRYALLLNTDAVLEENAVAELFSFMENHADAGMACGQLLNADGSRQNSIAAFPTLLTLMVNKPLLEYMFPRRFPSKRTGCRAPVEVDSGVGACLLVRRKAMDETGLFDERYFFFFEETDWALQMKRAGWKVFHVPSAFIVHLQGQSIGTGVRSRIEFYRSRYQFFRKWKSRPYCFLAAGAIRCRLFVNFLSASLVNCLTLFAVRKSRDRWLVYARLLLWHLRGCPRLRA